MKKKRKKRKRKQLSPTHGPFRQTDIPEISDFNVFEEYQRKGIGQKLLDEVIEVSKQIPFTKTRCQIDNS